MRREIDNKYRNVIATLFIFILYFAWPYFLTAIFDLLRIEGIISLSLRLILNFVLLGTIIYILRDSLKKELIIFKKNWKKNISIGFIALLCGIVLYGALNMIIFSSFPDLENQNYETMSQMFSTVPTLLFISTIFYYPVVEELVFKHSFKKILKNKWSFIIITGLLNAFFQIALSAYTNSLVFIYLIPMSLIYMTFSYSYYKTDSVFTSIIFRMFYNLIPNIANLVVGSFIINFII